MVFIGWIFNGLGAAAILPIRRASAGQPISSGGPGYPWTPMLFVLVGLAIFLFLIGLPPASSGANAPSSGPLLECGGPP